MEPPGEETKEEPHWELDDKARALAKQQEIQAREADEQRRQQELISAYAHSVARDAANDNKDDWSELRTGEDVVVEGTVVDNVSSWLFGSSNTSVPESPRDQLIRDAILDKNTVIEDDDLERQKQESALRHWKNYDIATSLKPQLVPEREYLAALKICRACRIFNQRREAARRQQSLGNIAICSREATKIKRAWRGGKGRRAMRDAKQASFEDEKDWKSYEDFRATLLGPGYTLSRWSHSKKALVPCNITVSKDRDWLLMKQPNRKTKKRRLKDIHTIAKGYKSPFLRDLLHQPKEDLVLTLMLRRIKVLPLGLGEEVVEDSLDFLFEVPASMRPWRRPDVSTSCLPLDAIDAASCLRRRSARWRRGGRRRRRAWRLRHAHGRADAGKGNSEMVNDGKFICKRFFANFEKLKREVESEEAFFFNDDGVYCQVGTSIFDRWEQITLIDPEWDKAIDDDEKRVRLHRKYEAERLSQRAPTKAPKHCYLPAPIPEGRKPQDDLKYVYLSTDEDGRECKATWHSRTVEIDYGEFKEKELRRRQQHDPSVEIVTVYRKEVFTLQACGPIDEEDPESEVVPLYGRHRKHLRIEDDEPVPAPFDDLLPYFRNKLQDVYGDIGVGGWRNTFDGSFELEDDCWRELCKLCEKGSREQKAACRKLLHALDGRSAETDDEGDTPSGFAAWRSFSFSSFSPRARKDTSTSIETTATASEDDDRPKVEVDEALRKKREQAVLDALWKKKDQREGTMWRKSETGVPLRHRRDSSFTSRRRRPEPRISRRSPRSFNTAQKKALEKEKRDLEKEAQKRIAEERAKEEAAERERRLALGEDDSEDEATEAKDNEEVKEEAQSDESDEDEARGAPTPFFDVVVLERSQKRKPKIPLGISVAEIKEVSGIHFRRIRLHGARECIPKCALRVVEVHEDACPYSISNASQNGLLRVGDYLVGVNDHYPDDVSALAKLAGNSVHRRVLTMARPHAHDHGEGSVIQI